MRLWRKDYDFLHSIMDTPIRYVPVSSYYVVARGVYMSFVSFSHSAGSLIWVTDTGVIYYMSACLLALHSIHWVRESMN